MAGERYRVGGDVLIICELSGAGFLRCFYVAVPGVTDFINSYNNTHIPPKMPYSKELTEEDQTYMHRKSSSLTL